MACVAVVPSVAAVKTVLACGPVQLSARFMFCDRPATRVLAVDSHVL